MKVKNQIPRILSEIRRVLETVKEEDVKKFVQEVLAANKIVLTGAGRMGLSTKAFAMRLSHLGFSAFFLGDSNVPALGKGDLLIIASGSGETQTIYDLVRIAKRNRTQVLLITANPKSRMGRIANTVLFMDGPTKMNRKIKTIQPMTTLYEQSLGILYDSIVLLLMDVKKENHDSMWKRHSNLE